MTRWLALLLLLSNALLLLWYSQQYESGATERPASTEISRLRLLHELGGGEQLQLRSQVCYALGRFASASEAEDAQAWLQERGIDSQREILPAVVIGYRLRLARPADAQAQLALLDRLALAGWVPQTDGGYFVLGPFMGTDAYQQAQREQRAISDVLQLTLALEPIRASGASHELRLQAPEGVLQPQGLASRMASRWPGIKIEKKSCKGVAQSQSDQ
ncbi:hypothetical protein [Marinobacterium weihaiense]|uniref:SPOR domain-containing protein n=1 Tax=Marinobacterium weihaiense TaxID=2851016 RepID=A0ABS6MCH4_9GAMM|nr:hypothetical protein [Marinobacterium weihaiense]MBV0934003.1 hypothetical protein [Marinobacterium weihaiense]